MFSDRVIDISKLSIVERAMKLSLYFHNLIPCPLGVGDRLLEMCRYAFHNGKGDVVKEIEGIERVLKNDGLQNKVL